MPRVARVKDNDSINYIFVKGITDAHLFREDADKDEYMSFVSKYKDIYGFKIYAYCIMQDYAHFLVDLRGADISSIMSSINIGYSAKYNRKYNRNGHLFSDRFRSKIIKDDLELKALTLYIHNGPTSLDGFKNHPEKYKYSSLGAYVGLNDSFGLLDEAFIKEFIGEKPEDRKTYLELVPLYNTDRLIKEVEVFSKTTNAQFYAKKSSTSVDPEKILAFIASHTGVSKVRLQSKYVKDVDDVRALTAFVLKNYYHLKTRDICTILGNISSATATKLFLKGLKLVEENENYSLLVNECQAHNI